MMPPQPRQEARGAGPERGRDVAAEGDDQPQLPRARDRARVGRKISATFVPGNLNELVMCFDFARSLPETNALQNGMRKKSGKMIMDAERDGHSEDVCTYVKADLGMMLRRRDRPDRRAAAHARPAAALLHRLLHLHEVVRADPPEVRLRDDHAARALPGRRQDLAEHARLRRQAAQGERDPDAGARLRRQVRHRPPAPVHEGIGQGRGRPGQGAAVGEEPALAHRRLLRRRVLHRADLHRVPRHAGGDAVLRRAARARSRSACATRKGPITPEGEIPGRKYRLVVEGPPNWTSFRDFWKMFYDEGAVVVASHLRQGRRRLRLRLPPRSRTIRWSRSPNTAWAATPT